MSWQAMGWLYVGFNLLLVALIIVLALTGQTALGLAVAVVLAIVTVLIGELRRRGLHRSRAKGVGGEKRPTA